MIVVAMSDHLAPRKINLQMCSDLPAEMRGISVALKSNAFTNRHRNIIQHVRLDYNIIQLAKMQDKCNHSALLGEYTDQVNMS